MYVYTRVCVHVRQADRQMEWDAEFGWARISLYIYLRGSLCILEREIVCVCDSFIHAEEGNGKEKDEVGHLETCTAISPELRRSHRLAYPSWTLPRQSGCAVHPSSFIRTVKDVQRHIPVKLSPTWMLTEPWNAEKGQPFLGKILGCLPSNYPPNWYISDVQPE